MAKIYKIVCDRDGCENSWQPSGPAVEPLVLPINPRAVLNLDQKDADDDPALLEINSTLLPEGTDLCPDCQAKLLLILGNTVRAFMGGHLSA